MNPYPKPTKKKGNTYKCSDGSRVTQSYIDRKLTEAKKAKGAKLKCEAYGQMYIPDLHGVIDCDHTISVARCKAIGKTELTWDVDNMVHNCREAHVKWESYRSGEFEEHQNVVPRMAYMKKHDFEGYQKRIDHLSDYRILKALREL